MNGYPEHESSLDSILSLVLRLGLALSIILVLIGGGLFLWQHGSEKIHEQIFTIEPIYLTGIFSVFEAAEEDKALAIIQLGVICLILTPLIRVFSCLIVFLKEQDYIYVGLSAFVLAVLLYSFF